jgi:riboflavin kinase
MPSRNKTHIRGKVTSGIGEGREYIKLDGYKKQIINKLGIHPFDGTLNIKMPQVSKFQFLSDSESTVLDGFQLNRKTYGSVKCYRATLKRRHNTAEVVIVIPEIGAHSNIIEVISPLNLRETLNLKDGNIVKLFI